MLLGFGALGIPFALAAMLLSQPDSGAVARIPLKQAQTESNAAAKAVPAAVQAKPRDERFVIKSILPIEGAIRYGQWHWNESRAEEGPVVITVDLEARVLSVFRNGHEVGAAAVLLGTEEKPTPLGEFAITQKRKDHVSNLYDAPMPYMMRLTDDGIAIHGSQVANGYASHGCIGLPNAFAAKLFALVGLGDRVFITRGKTIGLGDSLVS
jgi:lipoprotein-anchoring transpeptidase ErfK/SrfK